MRKSLFVLGALFLTCVPSYAACPNAACDALADRCKAMTNTYTKQGNDAFKAIANGADATGPEGAKAIAAMDATAQQWQSGGDCAVMMKWAKLSGLEGQRTRENEEAARVRVMRAAAYYTKGDLDHAITDYSDAIRISPILPPVPPMKTAMNLYANRGFVYYAKGDVDRAMADYEEAIRLDAKSSSAYFHRGIANLYGGSISKALADINQANALDPKNAYIALWLDIVSNRSNLRGRLAQAVSQLDMTKWPAPVVRLYLGQMTPEAVLAAADDPKPETKKVRFATPTSTPANWHCSGKGKTKPSRCSSAWRPSVSAFLLRAPNSRR